MVKSNIWVFREGLHSHLSQIFALKSNLKAENFQFWGFDITNQRFPLENLHLGRQNRKNFRPPADTRKRSNELLDEKIIDGRKTWFSLTCIKVKSREIVSYDSHLLISQISDLLVSIHIVHRQNPPDLCKNVKKGHLWSNNRNFKSFWS